MKPRLLAALIITALTAVAVYSQRGQLYYRGRLPQGGPAQAQALAAPPPHPDSAQLPRSRIQAAVIGDSGTGMKVKEDGHVLIIDLKPCEGKRDYMNFRKPYDEEYAGEIVCGEQTIKLAAVTQR